MTKPIKLRLLPSDEICLNLQNDDSIKLETYTQVVKGDVEKDYNNLNNKPRVNNVVLKGSINIRDIGAVAKDDALTAMEILDLYNTLNGNRNK